MDSSTPPESTDLYTCSMGKLACPVLADLKKLQDENAYLQQQVRTDALTGLYNYRFFADTLPLEMERARRFAQPLSLVLVDIDHFKRFNDRWGHELGNRALQHVAKIIVQTLRKLDFACRFGGEEFVVILPNTDLRQARNVAERLRESLEQTPLVSANEPAISITASLGVDEFRANHSDTSEGFLERVDTWLYRAKHAGRNCVMSPEPADIVVESVVTSDEKEALFGAFGDDTDAT